MLPHVSECRAYTLTAVRLYGKRYWWVCKCGAIWCRTQWLTYMSLFTIGADVTLQTWDHPLVHVVGHHTHHFHTSLDLHKHQKGKEEGGMREKSISTKWPKANHQFSPLIVLHCWSKCKQNNKDKVLETCYATAVEPMTLWRRNSLSRLGSYVWMSSKLALCFLSHGNH